MKPDTDGAVLFFSYPPWCLIFLKPSHYIDKCLWCGAWLKHWWFSCHRPISRWLWGFPTMKYKLVLHVDTTIQMLLCFVHSTWNKQQIYAFIGHWVEQTYLTGFRRAVILREISFCFSSGICSRIFTGMSGLLATISRAILNDVRRIRS